VTATLASIQIETPWHRLHRAESSILAALLSPPEAAAVSRRLGSIIATPPWIPPNAGPGGRFAEAHGPGALYLGHDLDTCLAEIIYHHSQNCAASIGTPPGARGVFRHLIFNVNGTFADVTKGHTPLHDPVSYAASWAYARHVRTACLDGVHYRSVRRRGGRCLGVFTNPAATFSRVEFGAVVLEWNGSTSRHIA